MKLICHVLDDKKSHCRIRKCCSSNSDYDRGFISMYHGTNAHYHSLLRKKVDDFMHCNKISICWHFSMSSLKGLNRYFINTLVYFLFILEVKLADIMVYIPVLHFYNSLKLSSHTIPPLSIEFLALVVTSMPLSLVTSAVLSELRG